MSELSSVERDIQLQSPVSDSEQDSEIDMTKSPLIPNDDTDENHLINPGVTNYGADSDSVQTEKPRSLCFVYTLTVLSAIGGFLFGYDTGVVSGAMILIREVFSLSTLWQELIVSITIGAAALFAIVGGACNNFMGRKPTILIASFVFTIGAIVMGACNSKELLLVGRMVVGIGIGLASMTVPMYIAESAPAHMRGRLVTLNNVFITGGQVVASVIDGAFSYDREDGWRYMLGLAGVPSFIQFVGFMFMPESPRWLVSKGKMEKAGEVLRSIRARPDVEEELESIRVSCVEDQEALESHGQGSTPIIVQMFSTPHVRRALILGCGLQMFQQISGINTVMYYSATIIQMSGVQDTSTVIWLAAITAAVNFLFTFVGLYLVDRIGRRKLTLGSLIGTMIGLLILAVGFQLAAFNSPPITMKSNSTIDAECATYSWCNDCIENTNCGFCYIKASPADLNGTCVRAYNDSMGNIVGDQGAESGLCTQDNLRTDNYSWAYSFCPTAYSWMAMFGLVFYLACFAPGMGPMPWTINSEIYPLWARSTGISLSTATNWIFNLMISMTFLTLTEALTTYGAFYLYSGFAFLGLIFVFILLPETRGKSLEEVEQLFMQPYFR